MKLRSRISIKIIAVVLIILVSVFIIRYFGRTLKVDLTEDKLYTLSHGTKVILADLERSITLQLYYSHSAAFQGPEKIRKFNNYYFYIKELLSEYQKTANDNISVEIVNPRPNSPEELEAIQAGLTAVPLENSIFLFGLVVKDKEGKTAQVPFFDPRRQPLVEYDITSAIYEMKEIKKVTIGLMAPPFIVAEGLDSYDTGMMKVTGDKKTKEWLVISRLRQKYNVKILSVDGKDVKGVDLLVIIHPKNVSGEMLYAIDQYVMKGGSLIVFQDPYCISDLSIFTDRASDLNILLKGWGIVMAADNFAVDKHMAVSVQTSDNVNDSGILLTTFLQFDRTLINQEEVLSSGLRDVKVLFAGVLTPHDVDGVTMEPLLQTTSTGNAMHVAKGDLPMLANPQRITDAFVPGDGPQVIAYKVTGRFKSNFRAEDSKKAGLTNVGLKRSVKDTNIVVFSDVDMINNYVAFKKSPFDTIVASDNINILFNSIDYLVGSDSLRSLRIRARYNRPFEIIDEVRRQTENQVEEEITVIEQEVCLYKKKLEELGIDLKKQKDGKVDIDVLNKQREIGSSLIDAQRRLRSLNKAKREKIEEIISRLKLFNMITAPSLIIIIAVSVWFLRMTWRKQNMHGKIRK